MTKLETIIYDIREAIAAICLMAVLVPCLIVLAFIDRNKERKGLLQ